MCTISWSSSTPESFESSVTIPVAISSKVSFSSVATALPGAADTTVWMCRRTSWFRSSIGQRSGSRLNSGRIRTCSDAHGLSPESVEAILGADDGAMLSAMVDWGAELEGAREGRWARFPRRCISRETSLESYVREDDACVCLRSRSQCGVIEAIEATRVRRSPDGGVRMRDAMERWGSRGCADQRAVAET